MSKNVIKKKIKEITKKTKEIFIDYVRNNRLFLCYILLSLINCFFIRFFTVGIYDNIKTIFIDLSYILFFGSFAYLFKVEKQYKYLLVVLFINTLICVINSIYYGNYSSFASISLLTTLGQVAEVGDAVVDQLKLSHFVYIISLLFFIYINKTLIKKN